MIKGVSSGRIITRFEGESVYRNDMRCSWAVETEPENRIQIRIHSSHLQWSPPDSICDSYDNVAVKEGETFILILYIEKQKA